MKNEFRLANDSFLREKEEEKEKPDKIFFLSVEGNRTEVEYFTKLSKYRVSLGINARIDVEVLKRRKTDTNSAPSAVTDLLDEFMDLRDLDRDENGLIQEISPLLGHQIKATVIKQYINNPESLEHDTFDKISMALENANYDLIYRKYLRQRSNEGDEFGIVIDCDRQAHKKAGLIRCLNYCKKKQYQCYITNPCFEFWLLLHLVDVKRDYHDRMDEILENKRDSQAHTFVSKEVSNLAGHGKYSIEFESKYLAHIDEAIQRAKCFESDEYQIVEKVGTNLWRLIERLRMSETVVGNY